MTWEAWIMSVPVATKQEISEWIKKRSDAESKAKEKASNKPKSGALPGNTEWL